MGRARSSPAGGCSWLCGSLPLLLDKSPPVQSLEFVEPCPRVPPFSDASTPWASTELGPWPWWPSGSLGSEPGLLSCLVCSDEKTGRSSTSFGDANGDSLVKGVAGEGEGEW